MIKGSNTKDLMGIYIDIDEVTLSVASASKGKVSVSRTIHIPTEYKTEGIIKPLSLNSDFFSDKQKWIISLKNVIKKSNFKLNNAVISLSHDFSITRFFVLPYAERKFWNKAIPIESKKYIPVSFDELSYDFYAYSLPDNSKIGVSFSVTQKKTTEFLSAQLKEVGVNLEMVEPSPFAMIRFLNAIGISEENYLAIYSCGDDIYTLLFSNSVPVIFRYVSFSKTSVFSDRKSLDLKGSLMFAQRNIPDTEIKSVFIMGNDFENLTGNVEREIGIKPTPVNLQDKIDTNDYKFSTIISAASSIKNYSKEEYFVDIAEINKNKRINKLVVKFASILGGVISGFFILIFIINSLRIYLLSKKINEYISTMPEISEFQGLTVEQVNSRIVTLRRTKSAFTSFLNKRDYLAPKLSVLADIIPKDIWLKDIFYNNPFSAGNEVNAKIEFVMNGETNLSGENRNYYMDYFMKEIKKNQVFHICNPPQGSMDYNVRNAEDSSYESKKTEVSGIIKISCSMDKSKL
ncbi:MAG: hypothetical protein K6357_04285 [Elusimicrobiota bacterium]